MLDINTSSNINTSGNNWILPLSIRRYTHSNRIFNSIEYASNASLQHDFRVRKNIRSTLNKKSTEKSTPKLQTNKNKGKNNGLKCKRVIYIFIYTRIILCTRSIRSKIVWTKWLAATYKMWWVSGSEKERW